MSHRRNLWLLRIEAGLTSGNATIPLIPLFYYSLGLTEIYLGIHEVIFVLGWLLFDIPTGWLADRFSRKICNLVGDVISSVSFLVLACATSFTGVLTAGILLALGLTTSQGADVALLRSCCQELGRSYTRELSLQRTIYPWTSVGMVACGGVIAAYDLRMALGYAGIPFLVAAVVACFIEETGTHRSTESSKESPFREIRKALVDMKAIVLYSLRTNRQLGWLMVVRTVTFNLTGPIGWIATPLFLRAGVPSAFVAAGWIMHIAMGSVGAWLNRYTIDRWSARMRMFVPAWVAIAAMLLLSIHVSVWTIGLFGIVGLCRGWSTVTFPPLIQDEAPEDIQATVSSVNVSMGQFGYMVCIPLITWAASIRVEWALIATCVFFAPLLILVRRPPVKQVAR